MDINLCTINLIFFASTFITTDGLKADFFLDGKFTRGIPPAIPFFDIEPESKPQGYENVLLGRHTQFIGVEKAKSLHEGFGGGRTRGRCGFRCGGKKNGTVKLLPYLPELITQIKSNLYNAINAAVDITLAAKPSEYSEKETECNDHIERCGSSVPEKFLQCSAHCLLGANEVLKSLAHPVADFIDSYCSPVGTVYQKIFSLRGPFKPFKKLRTFVSSLSSPSISFKELAKHAWDAVLNNCIELVQTDMMPFRLLTGQLNVGLLKAQSLSPRTDITIKNLLCNKIDGSAALSTLADVLHRKTALADILLRGFCTINLVKKYVAVSIQEIFAATIEAIKVAAGTACGLIQFAESGETPECDQLGGIPVPGIPLPDNIDESKFRPECQKDPSNTYGDSISNVAKKRKRRSLGSRRTQSYFDGMFDKQDGAKQREIPHESRVLRGRFETENHKRSLMVGRDGGSDRRARGSFSGRYRGSRPKRTRKY